MKKVWQRQQFKSLQKEWDQILSASGFRDIEKEINGDRVLKQYAGYPFRKGKVGSEVREEKLTYFTLISQFTAAEKFDDESERQIMEKTGEGWEIKEISALLKGNGLGKSNRDTIRYIRRRYEDKWGIRQWKPEEMVSRRVRAK